MRPRQDVDHGGRRLSPMPSEADPYEVIAHLRESLAKWQSTCQRLRAQRDTADAHARAYELVLEDVLELANGDFSPPWTVARIDHTVSRALGRRVPDSDSQVPG